MTDAHGPRPRQWRQEDADNLIFMLTTDKALIAWPLGSRVRQIGESLLSGAKLQLDNPPAQIEELISDYIIERDWTPVVAFATNPGHQQLPWNDDRNVPAWFSIAVNNAVYNAIRLGYESLPGFADVARRVIDVEFAPERDRTTFPLFDDHPPRPALNFGGLTTDLRVSFFDTLPYNTGEAEQRFGTFLYKQGDGATVAAPPDYGTLRREFSVLAAVRGQFPPEAGALCRHCQSSIHPLLDRHGWPISSITYLDPTRRRPGTALPTIAIALSFQR